MIAEKRNIIILDVPVIAACAASIITGATKTPIELLRQVVAILPTP